MTEPRLKEILDHAAELFKPKRNTIDRQHKDDMKVAQFAAYQTGNLAAVLPAEAECVLGHIRTLVVAKAQSLADAYNEFKVPAGPEAKTELSRFYSTLISANTVSFTSHASGYGGRTGRSTSQVPFLVQGFERETQGALFGGQSILATQRVQMSNKTPASPSSVSINVQGDHARINNAVTDKSSNVIYATNNVFEKVRAELENQAHVIDALGRAELVSRLQSIEHAPNRASAIEQVNLFLSLAANSATIATAIQSFIDPLMKWAHHL